MTLVGNDTGGALCQIAASHRPAWLGRLVLTSCDAFEHFPPPMLKPLFVQLRHARRRARRDDAAARARPATPAGRVRLLTHEPIPDGRRTPTCCPRSRRRTCARTSCASRAGSTRATRFRPRERLKAFDRPALIAWSADDKFFPRADGERLASTIPGARFELVEGARTFSPEDRPERLAELIAAFARERTSVGGAA